MVQEVVQEDDEHNDGDISDAMNELSTEPVSQDRAERFYDRLRERVRNYLEKKGALAGKTGEYLMLIYADPASEPLAEGTFHLVGPSASGDASAGASPPASPSATPQ